MLAQSFELLGRQRVAPLGIGLLDAELCVGCHLILSGAGAAQAAERGTQPERGPGHERSRLGLGMGIFNASVISIQGF
jgi:hypothetical protein